jgi:signal transduction histidine kinase
LSFVRPMPAKSFAVSRVNKMLGRVYSIALIAIMTEAIVNGLGQLAFLNPLVFLTSASLVLVCVLGVVISQWFIPSQANFWLRAVAILSLVLLASWPLHFDFTQPLPASFQPWIWWTLGISAVAAGTTFRFSVGVGYLILVSVAWPLLKTSWFAGSGELLVALQDALHLFIFAAILIAMVLALRWEAGKTDSANQRAISSAVESARLAAIELERSRLDALVHDSVLTSLLVASKAETPEQKALAAKSARDAIVRLEQAQSEDFSSGDTTLASFFTALESRIRQNAPEFEVSLDRLNDLPVPSEIAQALTEATLQAVDNSLKHAGNVTQRIVRLRGHKAGLKIVISDDGRGFRPSQVPKDRLGISSSIIARVQNIGGRVFINSNRGQGTQVVIEWGRND